MSITRSLVALSFALCACDPRARISEGGGASASGGAAGGGEGESIPGVTAPPANPSRAGESCGASAHCEKSLRCVEQVCRSSDSSRLGEYLWTAGEMALEKGDILGAISAYQQSTDQFKTDKVEPPVELLCSYGRALRKKTGDARAAEQAARLLHRCLLETLHGSAEHHAALRELVELEALGLEPKLLAGDKLVDTYLINGPKRPPSEAVKLDVAQSTPHKDRGYAAWVQALSAEDMRGKLLPCWETFFAATQKSNMVIAVAAKVTGYYGDDDAFFAGKIELQPDAGGSDPKATQCVRDVVTSVTAELNKKRVSGGAWTGAVTFTLSMP